MRRRAPVRLPAGVTKTMMDHARAALPRECCGFLLGTARRVTLAVPMRNVAPGRTRYRIDPAAHIALRRVLRVIEPRLAIVGVYHSHPNGPAEPSETDIAEALYPDWIHVIVGLGGGRPEVRVFRIAGGKATPAHTVRAR